ncbi:MAG: peptidylprolyl isomerase [candidate division Zixibacteria bacterium CG_4_9_14_3_um_filter_46_8]|nr:MAG: peptidylprolyl isomerase [candidate division Zixibacteria bacterium CG_4_9_14_3_um_filter_46_8]
MAVFLIGCSAKPVAKEGDKVKVHYVLKLEDGVVFDSSSAESPLEVTLGSGGVIPGLEKGIMGMKVGENKTITLSPEDAYGLSRPEMFMTVPKTDFPPDLNPAIGQQLQMRHPSGQVFNVTVKDVMADSVTLDGNHPLAGKTLIFDVQLKEIAASEVK